MSKRKSYPQICRAMQEHFYLLLTDEQVKQYASKTLTTRQDAAVDCTDTMTRDYLIHFIVVDVLGEKYHWPTNGDNTEWTNLFYDKFFPEAVRKGIVVDSDVLQMALNGEFKKRAEAYREATRFK